MDLSRSGQNAVFNTGGNFMTMNGNVLILSGSLYGPGGLQKIGDNALTLTAINTYSGDTTVSAGAILICPAACCPPPTSMWAMAELPP